MYYTGKFFGKSIDSVENLSIFHNFFVSNIKKALLIREIRNRRENNVLSS